LWINQKVNEAAPFASSSDPQPLYTGRLQGEAHQTSGRATVYRAADGTEYLRLTDFSTSNGPDVHVLLGRSGDDSLKQEIVKGQLDSIELGSLKGPVRESAEIRRCDHLLRAISCRVRHG
jgi:hypothetical protein